MIWDEIDGELSSLAEQGLQRRRRILDTPCGVEVEVDGSAMLSFCSNDYLGLAADPALIEAAREAATRWGVGSGASHL
ncbi:MAG: 8-amino-7-oxononanoate synthase, partial [Oxalobacteraceae bacterium]